MDRIMIAATSSGSGKTTISIGIMAVLQKRGLTINPFKVGPDYIDAGFHKFVLGKYSYNLDSWMFGEDNVKYSLIKHSKNKGISVIEGVMGLFDGIGYEGNTSSSGYVAKVTKTPVILIIDGRKKAQSAAAIALGFAQYDKEVHIAGVIINQVSGEQHYNMIIEAIENKTNIKCLGYLPKMDEISLESRHLGLVPVEEINDLKFKIEQLVNQMEKTINFDSIIKLSKTADKLINKKNKAIELFIERNRDSFKNKKIGVARDEAFSFYYQDNIELLNELGIEMIEFSPLYDKKVPIVDCLYFGGGFPEVFGEKLEGNILFRETLKDQLENGLNCYAECGGFMYLTKNIMHLDGRSFDMVGFFDCGSTMTKRLHRFGYVEVNLNLLNNKLMVRAHEFHRSKIINGNNLNYIYDVKKYRNNGVVKKWKCGAKKNNTIAGYAHIHFFNIPECINTLFFRR